jgi:hypothetical protein
MANAQTKTATKTVISGITLELSVKEAFALQAILANVGGDPDKSLRAEIDNIYNSLLESGIRVPSSALLTYGDIIFSDNKSATIKELLETIETKVALKDIQDYRIDNFLRQGEKIQAIKLIRELGYHAGVFPGLKESKEEIDRRAALLTSR